MSVRRYASMVAYVLVRLCVAVREITPYHIRAVWHSLRHGGWKSLQDEIFQQDAVMAPAPVPRPLQAEGKSRKGVLVIDRSLPRFDRDAGSRATWQYIRLLHEMGFRVTVWGHDFLRREPYATLLEDMGVEVVSGGTLVCGRWRSWVRARASTLDYVLIHRPNVAVAYMDFLQKETKARVLYFGVDLRWLRNQRRYEVERDPFHLAEARYWQAIENRLVGMAHSSYFYSCAESGIVTQQVPGARVRTVPLFIFQGTTAEEHTFDEREGLIFVGGFAHQPNVDGILWFVSEIYPAIREQLGEVTLRVVGANPPEALRRQPGVVLLGTVSDADLQALYDHSRVVVAPLRYGAGIKGKVVEAVFQHIPLVTTSIGAEGMPESEAVLEIHDHPHDFTASVIDLYCNGTAWAARSARMGNYVAEHFSVATARRILEQDVST